MKILPLYPEFAPLSLEMAREISPQLVRLPDGISEYSFAGFYLFRHWYNYRASLYKDLLIISGELDGKTFFITPCCKTSMNVIVELFKTHDYWKLISPAFLQENRKEIEAAGYEILEDRNNHDYVYSRTDLATLSGKRFHKKKNHVNAFENTYPDHHIEPLNMNTRIDALTVLDAWASHIKNPEKTDYAAAREALELLDQFEMFGIVLYVEKKPVAWTLAEMVSDGTMAAVHFEKARTEYRGVYQWLNYVFAQKLPETVTLINREQDLGDEGLRQAKMTYRPCAFVEKYRIEPKKP
ncbi:MAG TPA: DUF2156 domain-containing protein [Treponema sp.]|nr:DUF2156 domain-containing protein [Treponema sp.]